MKLPISDMQGKNLGEFELDDALLVFDKGGQAVQQAVVAHRAARRAGTASTLTKGEVSGAGGKPWKQKGLGRARSGYRQSPVWRGGSVAFGPRPRKYYKALSKKAARLAFRRAFSEKVAEGNVAVIEELSLAEPRTRDFAAVLDGLRVDSTVLFIIENPDRNIALASRNIPGVHLATARNVNTYDLLRSRRVVVSKGAMDVLRGRLAGPEKGRS